ncbi:MAG: cobalamin-dependent protein [Eubacteriaceae bacterium]
MSKITEITTAVEVGKSKIIAEIVQDALNEGLSANEILQAMIGSMSVVGDKFSSGEIFVPEMLISARAMQKGVEVLKPILAGEGSISLGKCIIGTVEGDLHDIGKNLVAIMIESTGFDVIDLGVDVTADKFIEAIKANADVKVVACSALLTTTMPALGSTVKAIKASGLEGFKVIVGGAPITQAFADEVGADAYAQDAGGAAITAKTLV